MAANRIAVPPADDPATSQSSLRDIRGTVSRHRWLVLGTTAGTIALVALYTSMMARSYESVTTMRLASDEGKGSMLSQLGPLAGMGIPGLGGADEVTTEIGVLRSRTVADEVAAAVGLHVELLKPKEPRSTVLRVIGAPRDAVQGIYTLRRQPDGSYRASVEENEGAPRLPERVTIGQPFQAGGATLALVPSLAGDPPREVRFQIHSFRRTVEGFREAMLVGRDESSSKLLEVSYRHTDPVLAAAVVNRVAESFIRYKASTSNTESRSTVALLRDQIAVYQRQLRESEDRLQNFQESQQVINPLAESTQQVRRLAEMQVRRDEMQVERASLAALLAQVRARGGRPDEPSPYRKLATFPSFIANAGVQSILETLTTLESERSTLLARRTETDPDVQQLTDRVRQLELQLYQIGTSYLGSIDNQLASMGSVLTQFGGELERIPARDVEFARLTREQKLLSEVYLSLQGRLKQAEIEAAVDNGEVRVVDAGLVAEDPVSPKPMVNLILATVLGLMLGFTAAFGKDLLDTTVRSREDAEQASLGLVVLGTIPRITGGRGGDIARRWALPRRRSAAAAREALQRDLVTRFDPQSPAAEAYRALRTSITFGSAETPPRVLVMTSALPGEGKSTNAANLAAALAQQGTRALLVDADMRRGALHAVLGARQSPGLAHVLRGTSTPADAVQAVEVGDTGVPLAFLGSGAYPSNPAELLGSPRMREVIEELRGLYDMVIFDAPPMNVVTDAAVLGTLADSTVVVARNGITERGNLEHAVKQLQALHVPIGGVILNDFTEPGRDGYYASYTAAGTG